jgi:hypothetical protein
MKALKLAGLGFAIWTLSLVWPEINQILGPMVMTGTMLALGMVTVVYALIKHFGNGQPGQYSDQDHPSRPMPAVATR